MSKNELKLVYLMGIVKYLEEIPSDKKSIGLEALSRIYKLSPERTSMLIQLVKNIEKEIDKDLDMLRRGSI